MRCGAGAGPVLGRCWADAGPMLGRCWADAGPMLGCCCTIAPFLRRDRTPPDPGSARRHRPIPFVEWFLGGRHAGETSVVPPTENTCPFLIRSRAIAAGPSVLAGLEGSRLGVPTPPRPGPGSEPTGVLGRTHPRSLRLAHRPKSRRRGPTRLWSLFALLIPAGPGPCRVAKLGAPARHALRFSPYPRRFTVGFEVKVRWLPHQPGIMIDRSWRK